jgi:ABC-2 type transport system ATP-binding protein
VLSGQVRPDAGSVHVNGVDMLRFPRTARQYVAVASQEVGFYPARRVVDNLAHFGRLVGLRKDTLRDRVAAISQALQLTHLARRRASSLSGGEKRRLHVAIALLPRTPLLFLDEPTANVDIDSRANILDLVRALSAEGVAVCYATHYLGEIEALGARVVMLDGGRVIARGLVADLVRRHGAPVLEVALAAPLPSPIQLPGCKVTVDGLLLRIVADSGEPAMPLVLQALWEHANLVRSIEMRRPSLDSVYLRLRRSSQAGTKTTLATGGGR